jgi:hypothetical protein
MDHMDLNELLACPDAQKKNSIVEYVFALWNLTCPQQCAQLLYDMMYNHPHWFTLGALHEIHDLTLPEEKLPLDIADGFGNNPHWFTLGALHETYDLTLPEERFSFRNNEVENIADSDVKDRGPLEAVQLFMHAAVQRTEDIISGQPREQNVAALWPLSV